MNELREEYENRVKEMTVEDLPNDDLRYVASQCGIEMALVLLRKVPGSYIVVPRRNPFARVIRRYVIDKFDGHNAKQLAAACGISINWIYNIIRNEDLRRSEKQATAPKHTQMSLVQELFPTTAVEKGAQENG